MISPFLYNITYLDANTHLFVKKYCIKDLPLKFDFIKWPPSVCVGPSPPSVCVGPTIGRVYNMGETRYRYQYRPVVFL